MNWPSIFNSAASINAASMYGLTLTNPRTGRITKVQRSNHRQPDRRCKRGAEGVQLAKFEVSSAKAHAMESDQKLLKPLFRLEHVNR